MTYTDSRRRCEPTWVDVLPPALALLERSLTTAFHAFDDIDRMTLPHRSRVVDDVTGTVPDAASAAARAGYPDWAAAIVRSAAERRPAWSSLSSRWDAMIQASLDAISAVRSRF